MTAIESGDPLFTFDGECYVPTDRSRGPWSPDALHGSPVAALIAYCVERRLDRLADETDRQDERAGRLRVARQTIELFRPVPFARLEVDIEAVRTGRRVAVFQTRLLAEGKLLTQASTLCMRAGTEFGSVGAEFASAPPGVPEEATPNRVERAGNRWTSYPGTLEMRHVVAPGGAEPPIVWIRTDAPVLADAPFTPTVRAASIADFVSPFANMQPGRSGYVNADITLHLHRVPEGEWHYLRIMSRGARDGIATAQAVLGDRRGAYGASSAASLISL
ncbi:MAG: thioesterase family protein [Chloroflexi bacterium]|nr:thioesterase family protein [Chloroflexota bacterium]MYB22822.1 thioesterase family protein [Chloroflexota bacterium]MYF22883.1 thioesterase family protein [Chloroflexota bacterium]MYF82401.1 thioesterase family protein [Chloroflexota bacterium]MYI04723.1 thioesterase family protein [Chloroflexota bacterium]